VSGVSAMSDFWAMSITSAESDRRTLTRTVPYPNALLKPNIASKRGPRTGAAAHPAVMLTPATNIPSMFNQGD
jgi:hypothetical protein